MLVKQTWDAYRFKLHQMLGHAIAIMSKDVLKHSMKRVNVQHSSQHRHSTTRKMTIVTQTQLVQYVVLSNKCQHFFWTK